MRRSRRAVSKSDALQLRLSGLSIWVSVFVTAYFSLLFLIENSPMRGLYSVLSAFFLACFIVWALFHRSKKGEIAYFKFMDWLIGIKEEE